MGLDCIIKVDEAQQADLATLPVLEDLLLVPYLHQCADHALGLAIGLRPVDPNKLLANTELTTSPDESMLASAFELLSVVPT